MRFILSATLAAALAVGSASPAASQVASQTKPERDAGDTVAKPVGAMSSHTVGAYSTSGFVENAARGDMFEIRASQLAEERASSSEIKKFAAQMVAAHTKTTAGLKAAMKEGGVTTPIPTGLDARRQGLLDNLRASNGAEFDKRYVAQQIAAHKEALALMKGYAAHGDNPALRAAAAKTAPIVADHLHMAEALPGAS
jgi:putative membrane protein